MFGIGRKDGDGRQVRIEHRGPNLRVSRTGGAALRAEAGAGPVNATVNTAHGLRLSTRLLKGLRVGLQSGTPFLIGRWGSGPLALNLSKSGASVSVKTGVGRLNLVKPGRSSAKIAGIQIRGRRAAQVNLFVMLVTLPFTLIAMAFSLAGAAIQTSIFLIGLALRIAGAVLTLALAIAGVGLAATLLPFTLILDLGLAAMDRAQRKPKQPDH
jgi:hypothetical protein